MIFAYLDESGDPGYRSNTKFYVLGVVLVHDHRWNQALMGLRDLRKGLLDRWRFPPRSELKASHVRAGAGPFRKLRLSRPKRFDLFLEALDAAAQLPIDAFSIAIDKSRLVDQGGDIRETAWRYALQRIHRQAVAFETNAILLPDAGNPYPHRLVRRLRRHHLVSRFEMPEELLIEPLERVLEDPFPRPSHESWFIQLADWVAYAAHRSQWVDPYPPFPAEAWDRLEPVLLQEVNRTRGGPPGMVLWP